uniref:Uncharacterized protein n=1 Tax=Arundo donax TaxID=35708 RepID=A0A0A8ZG78_ARUDO
MAYLARAHIWMTDSSKKISHEVTGIAIPDRIRKVMTAKKFRTESLAHKFYNIDYAFKMVTDGEVDVTILDKDNKKSWKAEFTTAGWFGAKYFFGKGVTDDEEHGDMIRQCRVIIFHFEDGNHDAYAAALDKPTIKVAVIHLDRTFSFSLNIYHTLIEQGVTPTNILDFRPW